MLDAFQQLEDAADVRGRFEEYQVYGWRFVLLKGTEGLVAVAEDKKE